MMNLDLSRLNYFIIAAKTENFQVAAKLLRITPAALSKAIRLLEGELKVSLFVRQGRSIVLTDEGAKLAAESRLILDEVEARLYRRTAPAAEKILRLGSFEVFTTYFLGELVASERLDVPLAVVELTPG